MQTLDYIVLYTVTHSVTDCTLLLIGATTPSSPIHLPFFI